jgi:hypothetical protein
MKQLLGIVPPMLLLLCASAHAQFLDGAAAAPRVAGSVAVSEASDFGWAGTVYLAACFGTPQGMRAEFGVNIGRTLFGGFMFGLHDEWSRDPEQGSIGLFLGLHFADHGSDDFTPYLLLGGGGTVEIFSGPDSYWMIQAGGMTRLARWLTLRPEIGVVFTQRYIGGGGLFASTPKKYGAWITRGSANVLLEMELFRIFD